MDEPLKGLPKLRTFPKVHPKLNPEVVNMPVDDFGLSYSGLIPIRT